MSQKARTYHHRVQLNWRDIETKLGHFDDITCLERFLSGKELENIKKVFRKMDLRQDGFLDNEEILQGMLEDKLPLNQEHVKDMIWWDDMVDNACSSVYDLQKIVWENRRNNL